MLSIRYPLTRSLLICSAFVLASVLLSSFLTAESSAANVKFPDRATVNGRNLVLPVKNPASTPVKGTLNLKSGSKQVGRVNFRIPAKQTQRVRVRLPRNLANQIVKKSKVKLRLVMNVRTAGGKPQTVRRSLTAVKKTGNGGPQGSPINGTYRESNGWTMVVEGGLVKGFTGTISTYCTVTKRQKNVYFAMFGDDPFPKVGSDGSYTWEATTNYGFVKLKYEGRIVGGVASGKMMVEDRSLIFGTGRIEFDYCFAGRDYKLTRDAASATAGTSAKAGKKPKKQGSAGWRIANVKLDGWSQHRLIEAGDNFTAEGRVRYRTRGPLNGGRARLQPRQPRLAEPLSVQGLRWSSYTQAKLSTNHGSWNCSHNQPPITGGLAGSFTVLAKKVRVQWSLSPTMLRCKGSAPKWSFPGLPIKAMTSTFSRQLLKGSRAQLPVEIEHEWRDEAGLHEVHWDGTITLRRG